jgi:1-pyrroline-5-carboxylate dehydrogenase
LIIFYFFFFFYFFSPTAPALLGNVVLWKPSSTALLSNYLIYQILVEAGLPSGVIQFLPGEGPEISNIVLNHADFAGLHFTGSTRTFQHLWKSIGERIDLYRTYPRIVGETGGKNFHFVHESADVDNVINQTIRSAFEYSGQKCSACSRAYIPDTLWPTIKQQLITKTNNIISSQFGQSDHFHTFVSAVIDGKSFNRIKTYLDNAKKDKNVEILVGGNYDDSKGFFIEPTILVTSDPNYITMKDELFGPVLTIYVYSASKYVETLQLCDSTSNYALTGSIFARDRCALDIAHTHLRHSAGNFYVNDKCTGAVVGQQAFGGARGSGTNDKAGALQNLFRWTSTRTIKETFIGINDYQYPHQNITQTNNKKD